MGVLELTALPSLEEERWLPLVRETDVLLVEGGDAAYLCHWMRASGLADLLPSLDETVWVGVSAGSMVLTPRIGDGLRHVGLAGRRQDARRRRFLDLPAPRESGSARRTPWRLPNGGPPTCRGLRMRSTTRPPSRSSTAPPRWSPRGSGSCSLRARWQARRVSESAGNDAGDPRSMIITTTENIPEARVVKTLGQVFGLTVRSRSLGATSPRSSRAWSAARSAPTSS